MNRSLFLAIILLLFSVGCRNDNPLSPISTTLPIVYQTTHFQVVLTDVEATSSSVLVQDASAPTFSPTDQKFAFYDQDTSGVCLSLYDLTDHSTHQIAFIMRNASSFQGMSWSKDGTKLAYNSIRSGSSPDIYVYDFTNHSESRVTSTGAILPLFSFDGTMIAFSSADNIYSLGCVNIDGTGFQMLDLGGDPRAAIWLPDGRLMCGVSPRGLAPGQYSEDVFLVNHDGTNLQQLTADHQSVPLQVYDDRSAIIVTPPFASTTDSTVLRLLDYDTGVSRLWITIPARRALSISVSSDHQWICYVTLSPTGVVDLYSMFANGGSPRRIASGIPGPYSMSQLRM